ncbi:MAG: sulfate reduction electron transfer complex DsrMKJOP subunit DsrM [Acidobacteriota bacterium]
MNVLSALIAVLVVVALAIVGFQVESLRGLIGVIVPYAAISAFLLGFIFRVFRWAGSAVPFRITTTCGQQKSLPWIKASWLESPYTRLGTIARMALEVLLFRSLFRNTKMELREGPRLVYGEEKLLWLAALAFHWSFLIIFLRHLRFFMEPVPAFALAIHTLDGFFQIGTPELLLTNVFILGALGFLLLRRLQNPQVRFISLFTDYFALFLIIGLAVSGVWMRYFSKVDLLSIKEFAMGLVTFRPVTPPPVGILFYIHLLLLSALIAYFPFSKLMHMAGVFLSPTRNLANTNRAVRHVNPWNCPVKVHTYEEWEEEFRDKIKAAGLPLEKE